MRPRPNLRLALDPKPTEGLITLRHLERLDALTKLLDVAPLRSFSNADLGDTEILLTSWGCPPIDGYALARMPKLAAIVHAGGSVKRHVTPACFSRGVRISSAATANALPVAEFTVAAILLANKRVFSIARRYRRERAAIDWEAQYPDFGNLNRRVGIVGASRTGRRVMTLLEPFDLEVVFSDPTVDEDHQLPARRVALDELVRTSDVVSIHAPSLPSTRHMFAAERLAKLKDGATLVNTARGSLVDQDALIAELKTGRIDAVIDTTEPYVLPANSPLYDLDNVVLTSHIAGSLGPEKTRMMDLALDEIERFVNGQPFDHEVRLERLGQLA